MINPFRTKKILIAGPDKNTIIEVPFLGHVRFRIEPVKIRGEHFDTVIVDEIIKIEPQEWDPKVLRLFGIDNEYHLGVDFAKGKERSFFIK